MGVRPLPILLLLLAQLAFAAPQDAGTRGGSAASPATPATTSAPGKSLKAYDANGGAGKRIFEIPIEGTIDLGLAPFVERVVEAAGPNDVVIIKMQTFGGRIDGAVRIRDALLDCTAKTVTYIDHEAASAGALISLASDTIIMKPGSAIGAATPVDQEGNVASEKVVSYFRELMRATAEVKGRRGELAAAMVDPDIEVPGVNPKGKVLTLTADRAVELHLADAIAPSYEAAIELLNLQKGERRPMETQWGEQLARFLTDPIVSSLLMTFGVLGLMLEFFSGGHGIGGGIGLLCLGLFFFGQYAANLAGWPELALFGVGVILLLIEIFFIPGFGVTGVLGLICLGSGLAMALVEFDLPFDVSYDLGYVKSALSMVAVQMAAVLIAIIGGLIIFSKYLPSSFLGRRLILQTATDAKTGYVGTADNQLAPLVGKTGMAVGMLRPAGIAEFNGQRVDVVSEGEYVEAGTPVRVVQVEGNRVVVKRAGQLGAEPASS